MSDILEDLRADIGPNWICGCNECPTCLEVLAVAEIRSLRKQLLAWQEDCRQQHINRDYWKERAETAETIIAAVRQFHHDAEMSELAYDMLGEILDRAAIKEQG